MHGPLTGEEVIMLVFIIIYYAQAVVEFVAISILVDYIHAPSV